MCEPNSSSPYVNGRYLIVNHPFNDDSLRWSINYMREVVYRYGCFTRGTLCAMSIVTDESNQKLYCRWPFVKGIVMVKQIGKVP